MTHGDQLAMTIAATQRSIDQRLAEAIAARRSGREAPHQARAVTDTFLAATSRHLAALEDVLVDEVRRSVPDADELVATYLARARDLEQTLALVKARLYGEAHAIHLSWPWLWTRVREQLTEHNRVENELSERLIQHADDGHVDGIPRRLFEAETKAPTRPHPLLPHTGPMGRMSRRLWAVADRFWDAAEGRVIPDPIRPPAHRHDSLMAQYLVADPLFNDHAAVVEHRHRGHKQRGRGGRGPEADRQRR